MDVKVLIGARYAVTTDSACSIVDKLTGKPLCTASVGKQGEFVAISDEVVADDESVTVTQILGQLINVYSTSSSGSSTGGGSGGSGGGEWIDIRPLSNTWTGVNTFNSTVRFTGTVNFTQTPTFASGIDCMGAAYMRNGIQKTVNSSQLTETDVLNMSEADARYALKGEGGGGSGSGDSQHVGLGFNSVSLGTGAVANNMESVAVGTGALIGAYWKASGTIETTNSVTHTPSNSNGGAGSADYSVSIGYHAATTADESVAIGFRAQAGPLSKVLNHSSCVAIGSDASAHGNYSLAAGHAATAEDEYSTVVGYNAATCGKSCSALGSGSLANKDYSFSFGGTVDGLGSSLIGHGGYLADDGVFCANVGGTVGNDSDYSSGKSTQFYMIGAGTSLADTYTDGEAGLGFVVLDHLAGKIVARGCCKLSSICTQHTTDFSPKNVDNINAY